LQDTFAVTRLRVALLLNAAITGVGDALEGGSQFVRLALGDEEGFTTRSKWDELKNFALAAVKHHHETEPLSPGLEMEALRAKLPYEVAARSFRALIDRLCRECEMVREENLLRLKSHRVKLGGDLSRLSELSEKTLRGAGFHPPDLKQLADELKLAPSALPRLRDLLAVLEREGKIVKIASDVYFDRACFDAARKRLLDHLAKEPEITAAVYRDLLGSSRKFAIALLDYFDHSGVTTRVGDARRLRSRAG
ncbi:MAG: SelB C-terminal domain-containing protein, partial [Candidatus Binataceae bacterium]